MSNPDPVIPAAPGKTDEAQPGPSSPVYLQRLFAHPLVALLLLALLCVAANVLMGKDINADFIAYHLYAAHALVSGQYLTDFMAAGGQSYLNPLGYLPLYFMIRADWPALLTGSVLACWHALNLWLIWRISMEHLFKDHPDRLGLAWVSTLLAAVTPVFIATVGGSFLDPALSVFLLAAIYAALQSTGSTRPLGWMAAGGIAFGLACGLKLTNLVFGFPMLLVLLIATAAGSWRNRVLSLASFAVAGVMGLLLAGGWWAAYLYAEHGNPLFPFFNAHFRSPDFAAINLGHDRFAPAGWRDVVMLPFRMILLKPTVYVEPMLPDVRPLAVLLALLAMVAAYMVRGAQGKDSGSWLPRHSHRAILVYVITAWILLFGTSGNGRYGVAALLLIGPVTVLLCLAFFRSARAAVQVAAVLCAVQLAYGIAGGFARWDVAPWTRNWIDKSIPARLADTPALYLSLNTLQVTMFYPDLAPGSAFVNLIGFEPMDPQGPGSDRVRKLLDQYASRTRMILLSDEQPGSENFRAGRIGPVLGQTADRFLAVWKLRVKPDQCDYAQVSLHGALARVTANAVEGKLIGQLFVICDVEAGPGEPEALQQERKRVMALFARASAQCPLLFPPPGGYPFKLGDVWMKRFAETDTILAVANKRLQYSKFPAGPFDMDLGTIESWERNEQRIDCQRSPRS